MSGSIALVPEIAWIGLIAMPVLFIALLVSGHAGVSVVPATVFLIDVVALRRHQER